MRITLFSITNFRSITSAHKIPLSDISTLIGKNNEGKSNILTGLNIAMRALKNHGFSKRIPSSLTRSRTLLGDYEWERDFPISKQSKGGNKKSIFRLEFSLDQDEINEFYSRIENYINGRLTIEVAIGEDNKPAISIIKSGKGTTDSFGNKSEKIAAYIVEHINFIHIPAVRTEDHAIDIVQRMLNNELSTIETDPTYINAINIITDLQKPILDNLSTHIKGMLSSFIPEISSVQIVNSNDRTMRALRANCDIFIDDGTRTKLEFKGDGIKSLVALSLLKENSKSNSFSIIAIEEPESHLHPGAIHVLRKAIYELGQTSQLIIATHNPLFVNRNSINSNIIINKGSADGAKKIQEIRNILGVEISDNLTDRRFSIVVEGLTDEKNLYSLLTYHSSNIKKFFDNNALDFYVLKGTGGKLAYALQLLKNQLTNYYVILDSDKAGKDECELALSHGFLDHSEYRLALSKSAIVESEFEDLINVELYSNYILVNYGVNLDVGLFRNKSKKWSDRLKNVFETNGKIWNKSIEEGIKIKVSELIQSNPKDAIKDEDMPFFQNLIQDINLLIGT